MSTEKENIFDQARQMGLQTPSAGMKVPDNFFETFAQEMSAKLPERPELAPDAPMPPKTFWETVRPYVYMAAMFAGIWCMLNMFNIIRGRADLAPIDNNPVLTSALSTDDFVYDYVYPDVSTYDVIEDMEDDGLLDSLFTPEDFGEEIMSDTSHILPQ